MQKNTNAEVLKNYVLLKKLAILSDKDSNSREFTDLIGKINKVDLLVPNDDFEQDFKKLFQVEKINEFGGKNIELESYVIKNTINDNAVYVNIGKEVNPENNFNLLMENLNEDLKASYLYTDKDTNALYDIRIYTGDFAKNEAKKEYDHMVMDYDRILNPQYYDRSPSFDLYNNDYEHEEQKNERLDPDGTNFQYFALLKAEELNKNLDEDKKIVFNNETTLYSKKNIDPLFEILELEFITPDTFAETISGVSDGLYQYLWNNLTKFDSMTREKSESKNYEDPEIGYTIKDLWDLIPEKYQEEIISLMTEKQDIKLKNGVKLTKLTPNKSQLSYESKDPMFIVTSKYKDEKENTAVFASQTEAEKYHQSRSFDKKDQRIPF